MSARGPNPEARFYGTATASDSPADSTASLLPPGNRSSRLSSTTTLTDTFASPYTSGDVKHAPASPSISDKFSLPPDPSSWGANLSPNIPEPDDYLHNPDPRRDRKSDTGSSYFTSRGIANLGCLAVLCLGLLALFAGYPLISYAYKKEQSSNGAFNLGGVNASGQVPDMEGNFGLIDKDTPDDAYKMKTFTDGGEWQLIFSDEFEQDGRTFYPGDDPYWEAVNLHYWQTNNMEWYDPAAITTSNGSLKITLSKKDPAINHDLDYQGGMMSTWNKFCFTGGMIVTSVTLPGVNDVVGLWPAVWTMGNLGRAGYGASLEGMWPYTYDACDVGTVANQTKDGLPVAALEGGDPGYNNVLSYLPGQRLSRCTCSGESHPGPMHSDGTYVGRAAPEIDIFEAQITGDPLAGEVSQSGQWAPFNAKYEWFNTTDNLIIYDDTITALNTYMGGVYQQATSGVSQTNQDCYELEGGCFSVYGYEYKPGFDDAYITWISDNKAAWTLKVAGMAADSRAEISDRPIPQEPMYLIANLGMSTNFGTVDVDHLEFPTTMSIDYIRVYQDPNNINIGCDPEDFPTQTYINEYMDAYTNPNYTTWKDDYGQPFPKNRFLGEC